MGPTIDNLSQIIATNFRKLRKQRGLTLDEVAEATGVSKSMLGQIEREECGLSVATLWKISNGLRISFTSLMTEDKKKAEIVDNKAVTPLNSEQPGFRLYPVFPVNNDRNFELIYLELDPGASSLSEPHESGTEEFVLVYEGTLDLLVGSEKYKVPGGHSIRYKADQLHCYANHGMSMTKLYMIICYSH